MLTMSESNNSGNQIYILPYCSSNQGISHLLSTESLEAGPGITIQYPSGTPGRLTISADGGGGGGITTTELNETLSSTKTITVADLKALNTGFYTASNCILKGDVDLPAGYYELIKIKNRFDGSVIAQDQDTGDTFVITFRLGGGTTIGWQAVVYTDNLPTFKTLFGDQSIEGTGNIDLYQHSIKITGDVSAYSATNFEVYLVVYSSKNITVDSLTDLKHCLEIRLN